MRVIRSEATRRYDTRDILLMVALLYLGAMWLVPSRYTNTGLFGMLLLVPAMFLFVDGDRSWILIGYFIVAVGSIVFWLTRHYATRHRDS